ncbi:AzlD domain-containing protein [Lacticaseibacillus rhamnosus]|uniref:AzlD domain-containing protein n=1 Tax=Lacticaseibacillus rhamnosus TaxID=47715 RepID=UPI00237F454A|nr:AzlD domain-containing protein [Lacticaseibacillus rhamnosus]MDE3292479.1 AzlD domain-containing protein [Lacticaseibacillus rhamnosus]
MQNPETFVAILSCGLATWLLRVVPIVLVKRMTIPKWLLHFLSFVPVAIITKSLFAVVVAGVAAMAILRLLGWA